MELLLQIQAEVVQFQSALVALGALVLTLLLLED